MSVLRLQEGPADGQTGETRHTLDLVLYVPQDNRTWAIYKRDSARERTATFRGVYTPPAPAPAKKRGRR